MTDKELSNLIKELLVIIDEQRVIDGQTIDSHLYSDDFVDTYESIRARLESLGELPVHHLPEYSE